MVTSRSPFLMAALLFIVAQNYRNLYRPCSNASMSVSLGHGIVHVTVLRRIDGLSEIGATFELSLFPFILVKKSISWKQSPRDRHTSLMFRSTDEIKWKKRLYHQHHPHRQFDHPPRMTPKLNDVGGVNSELLWMRTMKPSQTTITATRAWEKCPRYRIVM